MSKLLVATLLGLTWPLFVQAEPKVIEGVYAEQTVGYGWAKLIVVCESVCTYQTESSTGPPRDRISVHRGTLVSKSELHIEVNEAVSRWVPKSDWTAFRKARHQKFQSVTFDFCFEAPLLSTEPASLLDRWKNTVWLLCGSNSNQPSELYFLGRGARHSELDLRVAPGSIYKKVEK